MVKRRFAFLLMGMFILTRAIGSTPEELYQSRLAALRTTVEFNYHPSVKPFIEEYLNDPEKTRELIGRSKYYFPMLERALRAKGLPIELKYLAATASFLDPAAVNASGASGIWMMAYPVSRMYKLKVNTFVDERRDPFKSSAVAAQHFRDLHSIYKSWPLVIASYGCSPVTLNKCIHISNNSLYFWDIYPHLPSYCKDLYPRVIATTYILNYYKEHGIVGADLHFETETDSIQVNKWLSFQQISSVTGVSVEEMRELNPSFRKDVIPYNAEGYYVRIPKSRSKLFELLRDTVYRPVNAAELTPEPIRKLREDAVDSVSGNNKSAENKFTKKRVLYAVKKGDNLSDIADLFDVSPAEIRSWNKMRSQLVRSGEKLVIWVEGSKVGYYRKMNTLNAAQKKKIRNKD